LDIHDFSDHFFPRSLHELGQVAGGAVEAAAELTKRSVGGLVDELTKRSATYEGIAEDLDGGPKMNYAVGLTAVLVAAVVSGLTGVYFEKLLKDSTTPASVWTRNIQLSFYSLFPALIIGVIINDGEEIAKHGFFDGYNSVVWTAIVLQAIGGVLASLCINYADNIAKNFATSISIVISFLFSVVFFDFHVTLSVRLPFLPLTPILTPKPLTYMSCTVPPRHSPRPPRNIHVLPPGAQARPAPAHRHRQLRENDRRRGRRRAPVSGPGPGQDCGGWGQPPPRSSLRLPSSRWRRGGAGFVAAGVAFDVS
jgi:UDP-sugar transporter A1/2/3